MSTFQPSDDLQADVPLVEKAISIRLEEIARASGTVIEDTLLPKNRLFAVLIGVDIYEDHACNLSGAVNDARNVEAFLRSQHPPVSKDRIVFLQDHSATASGIIKSLTDLCTNDKIARNDPILIYYAGHGSTLPKPAGWESASPRIQCLSPHDAHRAVGETVVGVIPDRTFGAILGRLADAKGSNITAILDCCHSGSGTRDDETIPRGMEFKSLDGKTDITISASYEQYLFPGDHRGIADLPEFANAGLRSHIVLAACGPKENAYEDRQRHEGRFTSALLRVLKGAGADAITYAELMRRLDNLPSQTPRCEGRDKENRILFDAGLRQRDRPCYRVVKSDSSYKVLAGQIHGVGKGDRFAIYSSAKAFASGGQPLVESVTVDAISALSSSVSPASGSTTTIPDSGAVAVLSKLGGHDTFSVHVDIDESEHPAMRKRVLRALAQVILTSEPAESSKPRLAVASASKASISIIPDIEDTVAFVYLDERVRALGLERLSGPVPSDETSLRSALRSTAHFFRHLGSSPSAAILRNAVDVRLCELQGGIDLDAEGIPVRTLRPIDSTEPIDIKDLGTFQPKMPRMVESKPVHTAYGVNILNKSSPNRGLGLLAWMFYFDCSTLEILEFYSPSVTSGTEEPLLPPGMQQALPLNYGDAGGMPLAFEIPPGQEKDGGFLRIFLSTRYTDMSGIAQKPVVRPGKVKGAYVERYLVDVPDIWDAITLAVVLK
ncbi:hypothetical protein PENSPDRAFT_474063 [Peniophora sp. CONT]|nr:hypothetical protein PENSPDRAFT_474063 [Peniophora sp. CONT]